MKLHSLEIQAFGPFSGKENIHFYALGENPLFLIDGPTGAGKSSILHAICYALYGETTDADRKELGLRCDHAVADVLTELSLEFSIRENKYRITRVPTQMRPAKRGAGETEQKATAHLRQVLEDGREKTLVARKKSEADVEIEKIVGLTPAQFLQVMVLPQGKFRELLIAKSDDRQVILSTLFQTEIYKRIEHLLKEKAGDIEKRNQDFEDRKSEAFSDVELSNREALDESIKTAGEMLAVKKEEKDKASEEKQTAINLLARAKELKKLFISRNDKQKVLVEHLQSAAAIKAKKVRIDCAEKASSIAPKWHVLQDILKDISIKTEAIAKADNDKKKSDLQLKKAEAALNKAVENYRQRDTLKAEESQFKEFEEKLADYASLQDASIKADESYKVAKDKKFDLASQIQQNDMALEKLTGDIDCLAKEVSCKAEVVEKKLIAKGIFDKRKQLEIAQEALLGLTQSYEKEKLKFEQAEEKHKQAAINANRIELLWFSNQAAVLAAKLTEQQPCPVCGSINHPNPAVFSSDSTEINQEAVDKAREVESEQFNLMDFAKTTVADCLRLMEGKQDFINELEIDLAGYAKQAVVEVESIYRTFERDLIALESKEKRLSKAKKNKIKKVGEREPVANQLKEIEAEIPQLITAKAAANNALETADKNLPEEFRSAELIKQTLLKINKKIRELESKRQQAGDENTKALSEQSAIKARLQGLVENLKDLAEHNINQSKLWQQALDDSDFATQEEFQEADIEAKALRDLREDVKKYDKTVNDLNAELGLLKEQLEDKQAPDLEKLQRQLDEMGEVFTIAETNWTLAQHQLKKLTDTRKKIEQIDVQQTEIKKQYEIVGTLSKAASGKGNVKVSLERFVLGNLLDQVLSIASQRLHMMSKGQYRLIRQNEKDQKRNTTAGLDLAIDDAYTGKTRPVATLSGGESFMASLALALGLSDVVQERSGGIQLDTLFIDEGFGSLDQDSLQLAINTLIDLQSTGRTIGIISHVSELKEQMAQRIEVTGSRNGSTVKTVV